MPNDEDIQARGRALSSPVRLRILRLCLHRERTNKEIAEALELNPATALHHVRTLLGTGFLAAGEPRTGNRGAKEIPYRATGLSWRTSLPEGANAVLVETFLQEIDGLAPSDIEVMRMGVCLNDENRRGLMERLRAVFDEYALREPDADGTPTSLMLAHHLDRTGAEQLPAAPLG
ncbi:MULTISPECIES: ArsR/SmtB family transcription factor [Arthrobacter]|uniref:Winged helix-turn-helix domain-containing protein n=1 Tax=Arthrobacter caoxuetaonis TaxID=2886935 RepID=A0A9X1MDB5_9MICC|nr:MULTISPECIES: winged helix-turn-helix domain-containing protein [Arthrobacter]MCC3281074.1 winged helix-turn-helix domain-containing protein [Arthrobacter caoxuetaonis]MCC3296674.1 winged helix-turn-helix domain-containing protein [Arthrobacter caoxuetaonis]MCC9192764.1 winged helix-turn-helix domain-containing protein [Arthrobacter sp. zg-Y916]USQ56500.1 winged helix-turn-helix domain-containing protein [Arthrobacter caoxuetaonis]